MLTNLLIRPLRLLLPVIIGLLASFSNSYAQDVKIDSLGFETFEMVEGDSSYLMKKYFIVYLKSGPNRDQSPEEASKIQEGHRANMNQLDKDGFLCIAGPMGDDGEIRGIMILAVPTLEEVQAMVAKDPAVISGRLIMDIQPFWAAVGSQLF